MKRLAGLVSFLSLFGAACVSVAELPERAQIHAPLPQGIQSVVIRPTMMNPGTIKNVEGLTDAPQFFAQSLKTALELKQPAWQIRLADERGDVSRGDITVTTELINIDGGSAGLRFWIGFAAGAAESIVKVTILDKTERELATAKISERTMCPVGACVESNEATVRRNIQSLAGEVADFVINPAQYEKTKGSG
jgi:hypothetical protein